MQKSKEKSVILRAKIFPADFSQIFRIFEKHFNIKFLKVFKEYDNFLLNTILGETQDVGVN